MITVEFTEQEINALHQLLHRACLHSGMDAAEAAVAIKQKLVTAVQIQAPPQKLNGKTAEKPETAVKEIA